MQELKQITLAFDDDPVPQAPEPAVPPEAPLQKKRGRKPKPAPLVPKQPSKRGRLSLKDTDAAVEAIEIPADEELFKKSYYSIGQVAEMFHVNHSLLRMWANEFEDFLQTKKNKKGDRFFRPQDVKTLEMIHHLLRQRKFTTQGARDFLKKNQHAEERFAVIQSMQKIKSFLLEIKASL
ncbi:MAG TPA: MerR family transcriptional regulator [Chitinophagaceae bacterium]|nr:MerR family transcriptional regulator [Chitinophagaceae bacterium]